MSTTDEYKLPFLNPAKANKYPNSSDVYGTCSALDDINDIIPEDQVQDRVPDYVFDAIATLGQALPHPDDPENQKRVTPDFLLELFGPITARAIVIAVIYAVEVTFRKEGDARNPHRPKWHSEKWRFVAKELGIGQISW